MKKMFQLSQTLIILIFIGFTACELVSDKNDDCKDTKMDTLEEPAIILKITFPYSSDMMMANKPEEVRISGSIRKIYCSGKESGYFTYNPTFVVDETRYDRDEHNFVFLIPQIYKYKFENTNDKLIIMFRVKIFQENGRMYESQEYTNEFYYKDIKFAESSQEHYIDIIFSDISWFEVTS